MPVLRAVAALLALSLMLGERLRSMGTGRPPASGLDDQRMGGFLLASAWAIRATLGGNAPHSPQPGLVAGMLYGRFFGKLLDPGGVDAGNLDLGVLTWVVGAAFAISLAGLWGSIVLPAHARGGD